MNSPVEVPPEALSQDLLDSVIENFVLREGTDYGAQEVSLESKIRQVRRQIEKGDVKIFFDQENDSVTLVPAGQTRLWNESIRSDD